MFVKHPEAYCLMKYASRDGLIVEWVWNSRDGVTPFGIQSRDKTTELYHVNWEYDRRMKDYKPLPGERIFVDATVELMTPYLNDYIEKFWEHPDNAMKNYYPSKQAAFDTLMKEWAAPGTPYIMEAKNWKT